jgi:hypothetical protein
VNWLRRRPRLALLLVGLASQACADPVSPGAVAPASQGSASEARLATDAALPERYAFAFVKLGPLAEGPFYEPIDAQAPALLAELWAEDEVPPAIQATVERAFGTAAQRWEQSEGGVDRGSVVLDPAVLEQLGYTPPAGPIWLLSPCGPVRARVDRPVLSWYTWGLESIELSWALRVDPGEQDCQAKGEWSQIAVLAEALPASLRYRAAVERGASKLGAEANPYAAVTDAIVAAAVAHPPSEVWLREVGIPDTDLVELTTALIRRVPGEACQDQQDNHVSLGHAGEGGLARVSVSGDPDPLADAELRGAFVLVPAEGAARAEVAWTVHERWGQALVVDLLGSEDAVADSEELTVASFHPEDFGEQSFSQVEYCGP